jgi:hypothetical protein
MLSQDPIEKHYVCSQAERLATEAALACMGFLGENYPFAGQLKSIW